MATGLAFGWQVENANGTPVSGAKVYFYAPGTTTPRTTYTDQALTVPAANPVVADSAGWFLTYISSDLAYDVVIKSADDSITYQERRVASNISGAQPVDATLTAIAGLTVGSGDYIEATGTDTFRARKLQVATYAALTAIPESGRSDDMVVYVASRATDGDGGDGYWRFDAASGATANGGTILAPDAGTGRWIRQYAGPVHSAWAATIADAITAAGTVGTVNINRSEAVNSAVTVPAGVTLIIQPGVSITGSQANSVLRPTTGKVINLGFTDTDFPPPTGEGTDRGLFIQFSENYDNLTINKFVSGDTESVASDGRFPTVTLQHFNDMRRDAVGDWFNVNGAFLYGRSYFGLNEPARGSSLAIWGEIYAFDNADFATGNTGGEPAAYHGTAKAHWDTSAYDNGHLNYWGFDLNVGGPNYGATSANREGLLICYSGTVNKLTDGNTIDLSDGNAGKRGSYGGAMQTAPGIGLLPYIGTDTWVGKITYPVRIGYAINGFTGPYDGANIASDGHDADATNGFDVGLQIGGWGGAWPDVRFSPQLAYNSKIGTGAYILDHVTYGLRIGARHPGGTAESLRIERGAGTAKINEQLETASFRSLDSASYVNFFDIIGSATGGFNRIVARGADANVGFTIETKADGQAALNAGGAANQFSWSTTGIGFLGTNPVAKQTVTGSRGANAALESLLTALAAYGLITDSTS